MTSSPFWDSLIYTLPNIVAYVAGFVYLAGKWRQTSRACTLALVTLAILLVVELFYLAVRLFVFWDMNAIRTRIVVLSFMGMAVTAVHAVGWVTLAVAVGLDRVPSRIPIDTSRPEY